MFIICGKIRIQSNVTRARLKTDGDDQNKVKKADQNKKCDIIASIYSEHISVSFEYLMIVQLKTLFAQF